MQREWFLALVLGAVLGGTACGSVTAPEADASVSEAPDATVHDPDASTGCTRPEECDDKNPCNGVETCGDEAFCVLGEMLFDGTACELDGDPATSDLCLESTCMPSRCGDGIVDSLRLEPCDDGNMTDGDGCDVDCTFSCVDEAGCADGNSCNGNEECDQHVCAAGTSLKNGTPCGEGRECHESVCKPVGCGNTILNAGEECDDGNMVDGDGCDGDCTFSCANDAGCDDGDACNGKESCVPEAHRCAPGSPVVCADDGNACTGDACEPQTGQCLHPLQDGDGDMQASTALGACGTDCDDSRGDVYQGASELCDGVDNDCDVDVDEDKPTWYVDCDKDGFASAAAATTAVKACNEPSSSATGCGGAWTTRFPVDAATTDCRDTNATVRPTQGVYQTTAIAGAPTSSDYDYNCDTLEEKLYTLTNVTSGLCKEDDGSIRFTCAGTAGWTGSTVPTCGASGTLSYCKYVLGSGCVRTSNTRTQGCR